MSRRRTPPSVASFGTELMQLLIDGAVSKKEVKLGLDDNKPKQAIKLRHRLHILRSAMRREKHPNEALVERAAVRIDDKTGDLIVEPQDSDFAEAIKRSGTSTPKLEHDPLAGFEIEPPASESVKK